VRDRIERLRDAAGALGTDAAIVSHPANRHYFSGYPAGDHAPDESAGILLVSGDAAVLYTSPTNLPWAKASVGPAIDAQPWERPWPAFLGAELKKRAFQRVAFEDRAMTVADHVAIEVSAETIELVPAGDAFHAIRAIKDDRELESIAAAARITDEAFAAAITGLQAGITERELAWRLEREMRDRGAHGLAFPICVAAGVHSARPHHDPTDRQLKPGEPIVIDMGAIYNGYCGDLTRTIVIGEPSREFVERYNVVLAAQKAALAGIHAGMTGREADAIARDVITDAGFGDQFIHGLGHGVGLLIHEYPSLGASADDLLEPGQVVTIEPGIYLEDWGGIRIEDLCVVRDDGLEVLSGAPK
jgi:Xaa-Pro aminopeptidase